MGQKLGSNTFHDLLVNFTRFLVNLMTILITCEMSRRTQIIAYIMLSIRVAYRTHDKCSLSSFVSGGKTEDNLKIKVNGVLTVLQFYISKHSSTFSRYFFYDKYNLSAL
jgi:hypothetical protein